jgi:hypothetical protein
VTEGNLLFSHFGHLSFKYPLVVNAKKASDGQLCVNFEDFFARLLLEIPIRGLAGMIETLERNELPSGVPLDLPAPLASFMLEEVRRVRDHQAKWLRSSIRQLADEIPDSKLEELQEILGVLVKYS